MTLTNKTGNLVLPFYFLWLVSRFLPNKTLSFILGLLRWGLLRGVPAGFSFPRPKYKTAPAPLDCKTVRIFAYSSTREQSNKRSGTQLKTESETWGETLKIRTVRFAYFFLSPHTPYGRVRLARFARKTLAALFTDFLTYFEKKNPTVLQSTAPPGGRTFKLGPLSATLVIKGAKSRYLLSF